MSTTLTCNEEPDVICSGTLTKVDLRRFGIFDENDRFVGIKPGVRSDDINPDWRSEALRWAYVLKAIDVTRQIGKPDRARLIACAQLLQIVAGVFSVPHYEVINDTETLCFGQLWYLTAEERDESCNRYFDSLKTPDWLETPEAVAGINHGLAVVEAFADGLRSLEDPEIIRFIRKASLEMIMTWDTLLEDDVLQDALKAILSSDKFSRMRTLTHDKSTEALTIYSERHTRLRAAKRDYTVHKRRHHGEWLKHVTRDDMERSGRPKIPPELLKQLPHESARSLALQWTATELNGRYRGLGATANTVRNLLKLSNKDAVFKTETLIQ
jgi:hypothetical protein